MVHSQGMNPLVVTYYPGLPSLQRIAAVGKHTTLWWTDHLQQTIPERHQVVYEAWKHLNLKARENIITFHLEYVYSALASSKMLMKVTKNKKKKKEKGSYLTSVAKQAKTAFLHGPMAWKSNLGFCHKGEKCNVIDHLHNYCLG